MTVRHHDHPATPGAVRPEDLDLYALHALPEDEAEAVETALISASPDDTASMLAHIASTREVAASMVADAGLDTAPPPGLRNRILDLAAATPLGPSARATGPSAPVTDIRDARSDAASRPGADAASDPGAEPRPADGADAGTERPGSGRPGVGGPGGGGADVVDLSRERQRRRPGPLTFLGTAAAAVALLAVGIGIGRLTDGGPETLPTAVPAGAVMPVRVSEMLASKDLEVAQGPVGGTGMATVLFSKSEDMAVLSMTDLPEPPAGSAYQLWLMGDHEPISAGTMEAGQVGPSAAAPISGIRDSEQIGITVEPAGGSPTPTGDVILTLEI